MWGNDSHSLERTIESIERDASFALEACEWINLGGGHMISNVFIFTTSSNSLTIFKKPRSREHPWTRSCRRGSRNLHAHVLDIVAQDEVATALLDVSITAHMPDCIEMPYTPQVRRKITDKGCRYRLGGNSCLAGDFVGDYHFEHGLFIRDEVVLYHGALHYSENVLLLVCSSSVGILATYGWFIHLLKTFDYTDYQSRLWTHWVHLYGRLLSIVEIKSS